MMADLASEHFPREMQDRSKIPHGVKLFQWIARDRNKLYRGSVLLLTFFAYTTYHLSRKPISVVKGSLNGNCSSDNSSGCPSWAPFDSANGKELLGALDLAFLFSYAVGMFISGYLAEHMDIRHFLTIGMFSTGVSTALFGMGYFWNIHNIAYFIIVQVITGLVQVHDNCVITVALGNFTAEYYMLEYLYISSQSSGWPSVVECVGNWFGKGRRGLIMGVWNSHTSIGNIAGSAIAGMWASHQWGWSFIVPGIIIASMGLVVYLFLVVDPSHVGCQLPKHHTKLVRAENRVTEEEDRETSQLLNDCNGGVNGRQEVKVRKSLHDADSKAISYTKALLIPGVIEYSLCLFFAKLVSYTFLFWLPYYIQHTVIGGKEYGATTSADLSTFFDVGGVLGGILAGVVSDKTGCTGITVVFMLFLAGPMLFIYRFFGNANLKINIVLMLLSGLLTNGPYALITTAVSANLGTHESLRDSTKAMATVTAIIDGTGSLGAALGPLLAGIISPTGWNNVYFMLITADLLASLFLMRQVILEVQHLRSNSRWGMSRVSFAESMSQGLA